MRRQLAAVAVSAAAVGYVLRSEAERRLNRLRARRKARVRHGRVLLRDIPHRYTPEQFWPTSCWCDRPKGHKVHRAASGVML